MQIRTAFAIGSGIAIGIMIGMGISEDTKCKTINKIRKNLIYALGGEEKKRYATYTNHKRGTTYKDYVTYNRVYKEEKVDIPDQDLLKFDTYELALEYKEKIEDFINEYGALTVVDLAHMRNKNLNYTWDNYGWKKEDLLNAYALKIVNDDTYILDLPRPRLLK